MLDQLCYFNEFKNQYGVFAEVYQYRGDTELHYNCKNFVGYYPVAFCKKAKIKHLSKDKKTGRLIFTT